MEPQDFKDSYQNRILLPEPSRLDQNWLEWMKTFSETFYQVHTIKKTNNRGTRWIEAPRDELKAVQRGLIGLFDEFPRHQAAHGLDKKDYKHNATLHKDSVSLFSLDLKDFYKNCTLERVHKLVTGEEAKRYVREYASYLFFAPDSIQDPKQVFLSTGSPLSPLVANLAVTAMDYRMQNLADEHGAVYSRYLDDMNFSFQEEMDYDRKCQFMRVVVNTVQEDGWPVNVRKTKWVNPLEDAVVITGVDVRNKPKVTRKYIVKKMRPALNRFAIVLAGWDRPNQYQIHHNTDTLLGLINQLDSKLAGSLAYIKHVSEDQYQTLMTYFHKRLEVAHHVKGQLFYGTSPISWMTNFYSSMYSDALHEEVVLRHTELKDTDLLGMLRWKVAASQVYQSQKSNF